MSGIPSGGNPTSENPQPGVRAAPEAASPAAEEAGAVAEAVSQPVRPAPGSGPPATAHHDDGLRHLLLQKKVLRPAVLAAIAVVFGLIAWWLYPARTELPAPSYTTLQLQSPFAVDAVNYAVYQGPATAKIEISVLLSSGSPASPPPVGKRATLLVFPPLGIAFLRCPAHLCFHLPGGTYAWDEPLSFRQAVGPSLLPDVTAPGMYASFSLDVKAHGFGVVSDGATAAAAVPKLIDIGPGSPNLLTHYNIRAANLYDWSTFPPAFATGAGAGWLEQMINSGHIPDVVATGINHASEAKDNDLTFLAGALVGVAGGALLSAIQEALHAND
jgi:hypothetical protein